MKVGIGQINATIGDFAGNVERLLRAYEQCVAEGADLVVTPELAIPGYPPRDLVYRSGFVEGNLAALQELAEKTGEVPLITGFVDFSKAEAGAPFVNAAAVLQNGRVQQVVLKCLLPTYDVFDEARYFQPGNEVEPVEIAGIKMGITICEDIWSEDYLPAKLYVRNPPKTLVEKGAQMILNLSASPYHQGKPHVREQMMDDLCQDLGVPIVYANAVGANDQLVFDGHSAVIAASGKVVQRLAGFEEAVQVVDLGGGGEATLQEWQQPMEEVAGALILGVRDYMRKCGFKKAVIGLSGGIDSALVATIAAQAIGAENVLGVTMPSQFSSAGSVDDSVALAEHLGIECQQIPIKKVFEDLKAEMRPVFGDRAEDVTEENMQARIRGLMLMSISNKMGNLLLTTGNKSELAVGYCTIYGDMCGGLAVISDLPKTTVFELCRWLNRDGEVIPWNTINKPPSAELRPDQKDQDSLPEYEILDGILEGYVEMQLSVAEIVAAGYDQEVVKWVARAVDINEWKRFQAAPGIRVSSKAFGMGRRYPIAQRYVAWDSSP
ncbi:MAG: NAD+ synthase [Verrucomicrobiales bacterium]|nr:NAD+ synthase [Verrucomicrobiales bacterium]